jgi:hypothetical protein
MDDSSDVDVMNPDEGEGSGSGSGSATDCANPDWSIDVVATGGVGRFTTYRIDALETEHLLFRDDNAMTMAYASRAKGASWERTTVPCFGLADELWDYSARGHSANQNLAVTSDGTVHVACTLPSEGSTATSSGAVFSRAPGATSWTRADLPPLFGSNQNVSGWQYSRGLTITVDADDTVHAAVAAHFCEPGDPVDCSHQGIKYFRKAASASTYTAENVGWWFTGGTNPSVADGQLALCVGSRGPRISAPFGFYHTYMTEFAPVAGAESWGSAAMYGYDPGSFINAAGYEPACTTDDQGRTFYAGYDNSAYSMFLVRKGAGEPIIDFTDELGTGHPDLVASGPRVLMSYAGQDTLRFVTVENGIVTDPVEVDRAGVGRHSSIQVDAQGNPRIAYYDHAEAQLKLASFGCQ